jgi:predicted DNA-binding transcriptional regulator YafY
VVKYHQTGKGAGIMTGNKTKLIRILEILRNTDEQHPLTIPKIIYKLSLYGITAERKSIARDINTLTESGYSILSAGKQRGYYMAEHTFEDYELKIISDAICSAKFLTKKDSMSIINKLKTVATPTGHKILSEMQYLDEDIKTDNIQAKYTIDRIITAVKTNKKITFKYYDYDSDYKRVLKRGGHLYSVSPYFLVWSGEHYYFIGNPDSHNNLTFFLVSMMVDTDISDNPRKSKNDVAQLTDNFDLGEYIRENINMYTGELITVKLKCNNSMLREIKHRFGRSNRIIKAGDSHFTTNVKVTHNDGLYQYLLQHSRSLEVLSPAQVRFKTKELLSNALHQYQTPDLENHP